MGHDADLDAASLLSVARDVTPRIAAERRLAEESRILEAAFDAAAQPIAVLAAAGAIVRVNAAAAAARRAATRPRSPAARRGTPA